SNLGSDIITQNFEGVSDEMLDSVLAKTELEMKEMLRRTLKPEFLNRIDETIVFKPLNKRDVKSIVKIQLRHLFEHLKAQDIHMTATDEVIDYLSNEGFDPQFGARPIKRLIQKNVLNELSKQILSGKVKRGQDIVLDIFDGEYAFRKPIKETEKVQKD
ncbi:type VI secretion system ATPase TssH, partial [Salibacteraceae bacterium]|nr:type VI secretion system ATPase TssH [Salibacteraceae bacterium]